MILDFSGRVFNIILIISLVCGLLVSLAGCQTHSNGIEGVWKSQGSDSLVYRFQSDGSVWLLDRNKDYPVWRYDLLGNEKLRLFDGMGRIRIYDMKISKDRMVLSGSDGTILEFKRE